MANVERTGGTVLSIEAIRHYSPDYLHRGSVTSFNLPPQPESSRLPDQLADYPSPVAAPAPPARRLHSPASPWLLTTFSDFSDVDLASSPFSRPGAVAPPQPQLALPQLPALPLPQPPAGPPSPIASHILFHTAESIFSSSPPPNGFAALLEEPAPQQPTQNSADDQTSSLRLLPPLMPPTVDSTQAWSFGRLFSGQPEFSSPRPRSSRRAGSSPRSPPLIPSDHSISTPGPVKSEPRRSGTPIPGDSPVSAMPVSTRKRAAAAGSASSSSVASSSSSRAAVSASVTPRRPVKRARTAQQQPASGRSVESVAPHFDSEGFSDPFLGPADIAELDGRAEAAGKGGSSQNKDDDAVVIDLVDVDVPPPPPLPPKPRSENQIKLGNLQCSICMDDMTDLTATHCGHLFCGVCLHGALHANINKTVCPICRQKIDLPHSGPQHSKSSTKGYWPLQLKIMTATRKGKRKEGERGR